MNAEINDVELDVLRDQNEIVCAMQDATPPLEVTCAAALVRLTRTTQQLIKVLEGGLRYFGSPEKFGFKSFEEASVKAKVNAFEEALKANFQLEQSPGDFWVTLDITIEAAEMLASVEREHRENPGSVRLDWLCELAENAVFIRMELLKCIQEYLPDCDGIEIPPLLSWNEAIHALRAA